MSWKTNFFAVTALLTVLWISRIGGMLMITNNTVAKFGDRVEFECSTDVTYTEYESSPLDWRFTSTNSSQIETVYENGVTTHSLASKYAVSNTTRGRYSLNMDSVDFSFAGKYTCTESEFQGEGQPHSAAAELIVIASDPVCNSNASEVTMEGSYIRMYCTVNYTGNWIPDLEWPSSNGRTIDAYMYFVYTNTSTTVLSSITMQLDSSDDGVTFTCKISFRPITTINKTTIPGESLATNIPLYQYVWSVKLNVTCGGVQLTSAGLTAVKLAVVIGISSLSVMLFIIIAIVIFKISKKGHTKPDVVPEANQNSNGFRSEETRPSPVYASVIKKTRVRDTNNHTVTNDSQQNQNIPVYEEVKKIENVGDTNKHTAMNNSQQTQNIANYEEVKKIENDEKIPGPSGQIQLPTEKEPQRQMNYVGADGTQYLELKSLTELKSNGVTERKPQMFNVVETYASIDHSMKAPPPPPQLPRRHCY